MYAYINGIIRKVEPSNIVVDNQGIGYLVIVPNPYKYRFGEERVVYTHHYVREDINNLYGFETEEAKELFIKLISVSGIGPKSALSILATDDINGIVLAIENGDAKFLTKFPGIGNKTAQQIILDLHGKLAPTDELLSFEQLDDAEAALLALGYAKKDIKKVLKNIDYNMPVEAIIKEALKNILK